MNGTASSFVHDAVLVAADKDLTDANVRPGLLGLLFFVLFFVALYFLWRSMNKQLKKVDRHFDDSAEPAPDETDALDAPDAPEVVTDPELMSAQDRIAAQQAELGRRGPGAAHGPGEDGRDGRGPVQR